VDRAGQDAVGDLPMGGVRVVLRQAVGRVDEFVRDNVL
jgi:hypothetical protein